MLVCTLCHHTPSIVLHYFVFFFFLLLYFVSALVYLFSVLFHVIFILFYCFYSSSNIVEDMIKEVDVDGDGRIDFYEFVRALGEPEDSDDLDDEDADGAGNVKGIQRATETVVDDNNGDECFGQNEQFTLLPVPVTSKSFMDDEDGDADDDNDDDSDDDND